MIVDHISNAERYGVLGPLFKQAFDFLRTTDLGALELGRHDLVGDKLFALVQSYESKTHDKGFWESHRRYIDLQFVVKGRELIGYAPLYRMQVESRDDARDLTFLKGEGDFVKMTDGTFMLLWPEDAHMPGLAVDAPESVRKIVFKIAVEQ